MLYALIVTCEVAFWVFLFAALFARYALRWKRVGTVLLYCVPLADLVLFSASTVDLVRGATPTAAHGLAAVYLGVSIAFGHQLVRWADGRFAHRFHGEPLRKPPKNGRAHAAYERGQWLRHFLAWLIGSALIMVDVAIVGSWHPAQPLVQLVAAWGVVLVIDLLWSVSYTFFPKKA
jgi:hypothetical protein